LARRTISTRLAIDGEAQYKQAVSAINAELRKHASALDLVKSQYSTNANSMEALRAKQRALTDLQATQTNKVNELNAAYKNAQAAVDVYRGKKEELTQKIEANEAALEKLKNTEGDTTEEQRKLTEETEKLKRELETNEAKLTAAEKGTNTWQTSLNKAQKELNETNDEIKKNEKYLDEAAKSADKSAKSIDNYGKETKNAGDAVDSLASALAAAGIVQALNKITDAMTACVQASVEFESAMTGVEKTTDLTDRELLQMADAFKRLSGEIPMAAAEIAGIAENAGQLGIQKENIVSFSRTMADLGVATNLSGEQAAQTFAKFANITRMSQTDFDRLGSAIVALGNNLATTEADIAAMGLRLAAAGSQAGFTESEILGLAGALSSVGLEAEAGGSAFSKAINMMTVAVETGSEELLDFAEIAGMSADEFATAYKEDAAGAVIAFTEGLGDMERHGKSAVVLLDELGLTEIRLRDSLTRAANSGDLFRKSIELGNNAWSENNALTKEAELRYGTTESRLKLLNNAFERVKITVGNQLNPALGKLIDAGTAALDWINDFLESNDAIVPVVTAVTVGLGVMVAGITAMTLAASVGTKALAAFKLALDSATGGATLIATAVIAMVAAIGTLALSLDDGITKANEMTEAARGSAESIKEITAAFEDSQKSSETAGIVAKDYVTRLQELEAQGLKTNAQQQEYRMLVDLLNEAMPDLNATIDEQTGLIKGGTDALLDNIKALEKRYELEAYQKRYNDLLTKQAEIKVDLYDAERREYAEVKKRQKLDEDREKIIAAMHPKDDQGCGKAVKGNRNACNREYGI